MSKLNLFAALYLSFAAFEKKEVYRQKQYLNLQTNNKFTILVAVPPYSKQTPAFVFICGEELRQFP